MNPNYRLSAFDSLSKQIAILDQNGVIRDVNKAWRRFARENGSQVQERNPIGVNYLSVCEQAIGRPNGEEAEAALIGIRSIIEGQREEFQLEYPCHSPEKRRWFLLTASPLIDAGPAVVVTHLNVTARKEAELAKDRAAAMLQGLFELAPVGICLTDLKTLHAVDFNESLCHIVGYSREELLSADGELRTPYAPRQTRMDFLQKARDLGRFGPEECIYTHKDGHPVSMLLSGSRVIGPDGAPFIWSIEQDISNRKALEERLRHAAELDPLTGLPNRAMLLQRLNALDRAGHLDEHRQFAVLFLDFDRFKLVNDTFGHEAGDELLVQIAERLRAALPSGVAESPESSHFVARFGGDEFVYVTSRLRNKRVAAGIAYQLQLALAEPYLIHGQTFQSTVSIGMAVSSGASVHPHDLLRNADTALYEAKRSGGGVTVLFNESMHERLSRSLLIEAGLRVALQRNELSLSYQPIVDLSTGRMSSAEALLRWHHPTLGAIAPDEFIPIAEDTGIIVPIGEWVLREACQQWTRWHQRDAARAPAVVSVNLSRRQLALGRGLLSTVKTVLKETGVPAQALQLEITERELMRDPEGARALMRALAALGVGLAMDDFGSGMSSLGCLRDYPFHVIKIDKSFVTDLIRDRHVLAVAHATVNVIENLGMISVAEGVESAQEVAMLQSMGCRYAQGYLFGRPMEAEQLLDTFDSLPAD